MTSPGTANPSNTPYLAAPKEKTAKLSLALPFYLISQAGGAVGPFQLLPVNTQAH